MSGHSKWHNIQKTKGAQDAKRAAAFTKISKEMIVAVKEGGGVADPAYNSRLATVITKAKAANMPNDNIKRVLEKAASAGQGDSYESITYEGHGPSGVAVIVETMTDNRNRTAGNIRHHFDKYGGSLGVNGCVSWAFDKKGVIVIDNEEEELEEDAVMMDALDAGAADHGRSIFTQMLSNLQKIRYSRMLWSEGVISLNKKISDILSQVQFLAQLQQMGGVDPDTFITSNNKLSEQLRRLKQEKARLLDTDSDDLADRTRDLMDVLEDGPDFLDGFDAELFDALVEKIIVDSNERLRFRLKNGLELTEQIERTRR